MVLLHRVPSRVLALLLLPVLTRAAPLPDLEALAWTFRFGRFAPHASPLLVPLQQVFASVERDIGVVGARESLRPLCSDACGPIRRLRMWGARREGAAPWFWPHPAERGAVGTTVGSCRLRRAMAPLYEESLEVDYAKGGRSWYRAHRGRYWRGCDLDRAASTSPTSTVVPTPCERDSGALTAHDRRWLRRLRPVMAAELRTLAEHGPEFLAQASKYSAEEVGGVEISAHAPSLDRLLLLVGRLGCLAVYARNLDTRRGGSSGDGSSSGGDEGNEGDGIGSNGGGRGNMDDNSGNSHSGSTGDHRHGGGTKQQQEKGGGHQSAHAQRVLVVGAGPVGLMASIQARLTGASSVTVWEKRSISDRRRTNVVVASETDQAMPEHPAGLSLLENIGLLDVGMRGTWRFPWFRRYNQEKEEAKLRARRGELEDEEEGARAEGLEQEEGGGGGDLLLSTPAAPNMGGGELSGEYEWDLHLQIRDLEYALQRVAAVLGVQLVPYTIFTRWQLNRSSTAHSRWVAVGHQTRTNTGTLSRPGDPEHEHCRDEQESGRGNNVRRYRQCGGDDSPSVPATDDPSVPTATTPIVIPVDVVVGADGEWSKVRGLANFSMQTPRAQIRMPRNCLAHARDDRLGNIVSRAMEQAGGGSERAVHEGGGSGYVQDFILSEGCDETILDDDDDDDDDDDGDDDDDEGDGKDTGDSENNLITSSVSQVTRTWQPLVVTLQITVPVGCGDAHRERAVQDTALGDILATMYDDPAGVPGHCQITAIFQPEHGRALLLRGNGNVNDGNNSGNRNDNRNGTTEDATRLVIDAAAVNQTVMHVVSDLLGYPPDVVRAAMAPDAMPPLKVFAHSFRFAFEVLKFVTGEEDEQHKDKDKLSGRDAVTQPNPTVQPMVQPLLVAIEGDGARQPFHQEGNGLNVGLFGTVDMADALARVARVAATLHKDDRGTEALDAALADRRELGDALTSLMTDESLRRAVKEVLFNQGSNAERINSNRWNTPAWLNMHRTWHDYRWHEMREQDRILWGSLGWNRDLWGRQRRVTRVEGGDPTRLQTDGDGAPVSWMQSVGRKMWSFMSESTSEKSNSAVHLLAFCPSGDKMQWEKMDARGRQAATTLRLSQTERPDMWKLCRGG